MTWWLFYREISAQFLMSTLGLLETGVKNSKMDFQLNYWKKKRKKERTNVLWTNVSHWKEKRKREREKKTVLKNGITYFVFFFFSFSNRRKIFQVKTAVTTKQDSFRSINALFFVQSEKNCICINRTNFCVKKDFLWNLLQLAYQKLKS